MHAHTNIEGLESIERGGGESIGKKPLNLHRAITTTDNYCKGPGGAAYLLNLGIF